MANIIYTVLFGDTDTLKPPVHTPGWDHVCITDDPDLRGVGWDVEFVGATFDDMDPKRRSRAYKINPPLTADRSFYVDATFRIRHDLTDLLRDRAGIWLFPHPMRDCAYREAAVILEKNLDLPLTVEAQITRYRTEGFPEHYGLWRCGAMLRERSCDELNQVWWDEISRGTWRDQLSFPYACWKTGVTPRPFLTNLVDVFLQQSLHKPHKTDDWKFTGKKPDWGVKERHPFAHLVITPNGLYMPRWVNKYISLTWGSERFIELTKSLNGIVEYEGRR